MKFVRKAFLALLLVGLLCGGAAAEAVDLVMWTNNWPQAQLDALQKAVDAFVAQNPNVKSVSLMSVSAGEVVEKLTLSVVGDTAPDLITLPAPYVQYQMNGLLQPIDAFLAKSKQLRRQDYPPEVFASFAVKGKQYGIPAIEVGPGLLLFYSVDLFAEAGLPDAGPRTLNDLVQVHKKLTRLDPNTDKLTHVGINPFDSMARTYFPDIWSIVFDVDWYDEATGQLNMGAFTPALEYIKQIYDLPGYSYISGAGIPSWSAGLARGRLGMQINGYWVPGELKSLNSPWQYKHAWMPSVKGDKATATLPWGLAIPTNAKHAELSFQLMEFLSGPQAAQIIFDGSGWLNGNLSAMRRLNIRDLPMIADMVGMFEQADRFGAPLQVPLMDTIRNTMKNDLPAVWKGELTPQAALANIQTKLQAQIDQVVKGK